MDFSPDVILAVASPPGRSARGIIRVSGAQTFQLLSHHLKSASDDKSGKDGFPDRPFFARGIRCAQFHFSDKCSFSIEALIFPAPHSYTGEASIELQLPGNPTLLERVIETILATARRVSIEARRAAPGEFTARAFLNGRMDLTQAEGVAATIAAQSDAQLRAAQLLTSGTLGTLAHQLADDLANALALVEAGIDFTDQDDVVAITPADLHARLGALHQRIEGQLDRSVGMEQLQAIPWVVLAGEPNAGKSALFNALLGHERAVVSPVSGTTRDVLTEPLTIQTDHGPAEVMLVDLAGLDEENESTINRLMQSAAHGAIKRAELILRCVPVDQSTPLSTPGELVVRTKSDLASLSDVADSTLVSAATGAGFHALRSAIGQRLAGRAVSLAADAIVLGSRHDAALRSAAANLGRVIDLLEPQRLKPALRDPELIAAAMRAGLDDLAALAGDITPDDVLGRVFATFCVGK